MDNDQNTRRERMLEKVRKLLAMAKDGRGNSNEADIAMRQANRLMAEFGIEEAECDMAAINAGEMVFGEAQCGFDGRAPVAGGTIYRSCPSYAGILAVGIARFTNSIVGRKIGPQGEMLYFRGEKNDVLLARWLLGVLVSALLSEQRASGWTRRGEANSFRVAAASTLARRLKELAAEREAVYRQAQQDSGSRALMVVDRKALEVAQRFGAQKVRRSSGEGTSYGAAQAGHASGSRINIPSGRPIGSAQHQRIGG